MRKFSALLFCLAAATAQADWFDDIRDSGNRRDLYRVLYYMPKGGDLHNHLSGATYSEWWYDLALAQRANGYRYYTKVRIENCAGYGADAFGAAPYHLMFRNISNVEYDKLDDCEKREFKPLDELGPDEKTGWLDSIRLDKPWEGREEFFQTHWQRLGALVRNPQLQAETLVRNMREFAAEGVQYLELQVSLFGHVDAQGIPVAPQRVADILRERLQERDALDTGVTVRFQVTILRFVDSAEDMLRSAFQLVHDNRDLFVAINMVGREDNDKGYPLRFLPTLRELRRQYDGVRMSIHAGEVDEPNFHVRDTLLLGADRIGHGVNLVADGDTMLLMRHGPYLVEINLISNLLLGYISDYAQHPFPEYLRTGIPVALSTDDRGMWDSTLTDEFFVATVEFGLSWQEITQLGSNSLEYSFLPEAEKQDLLRDYRERIEEFERGMQKRGVRQLGPMPATRGFVCGHYDLCD